MSARVAPLLSHLLEQLEGSVSADGEPGSSGGASRDALRSQALLSLREGGLPSRKTEDWRATPLKPLLSTEFPVEFEHDDESARSLRSRLHMLGVVEPGEPTLVFLNGVPLDGVDAVGPQSDGLVVSDEVAGPASRLGQIAKNDHFVAVNTALFQAPQVVTVSGAAEHRLHIVHVVTGSSGPRMRHPRLFVEMKANSSLRLQETLLLAPEGAGPDAAAGTSEVRPVLLNGVTELWLQEGARLDHSRHVESLFATAREVSQGGTETSRGGFALGTVVVRQEKDSHYASHFVSLGGALNRSELQVEQVGNGATCSLGGIYFADGSDHVEQQTKVTHAALGGSSEQVARGLVTGRATGVFNGVAVVQRGADQTNAHQDLRTLLLSDDAVGYAKPHLEIDTDDVACSHGATVGTLDDDAVFYLRSRGLGDELARAMMTVSFASEVVSKDPSALRRRWLLGRIARRLSDAFDLGDPGQLVASMGWVDEEAEPEPKPAIVLASSPAASSGATASAPPPLPVDPEAIRADFPALSQQVNGKPLVYLDSAATALKPQVVIDAVVQIMARDCANVHRAVHTLSQRATLAYEGVREKVAAFLGASSSEEIVYQHGTTEAMNLVAEGFARPLLKRKDEILITGLEHHATIVPWQRLAKAKGAKLRVVPLDENGSVSVDTLRKALRKHTRFVVVSHVSNTLGTILPIAEICAAVKEHGDVKVVVDGAQAAAHLPIDVKALGCDFYAFSSHKIYGPSGAGVLWGKKELLQEMQPLLAGGDMIDTVTYEESTYADPPHRFEAGTPAIEAVVGMGAAIDYLMSVGMGRVRRHDVALVAAGYEKLMGVSGLRLLGWPKQAEFETRQEAERRVPVFSFVMEGVHPSDLGTMVDVDAVAIRTGHHCAMPLMNALGVPGSARASAGIYNTPSDFDALVAALKKARARLTE